MSRPLDALIFDLDGVIVDTAKYHFLAWKSLAHSLDIDFDEEKNEKLKGVSRVESLIRILDWGGIQLEESDFAEALDRKNQMYLEYVRAMDRSEILPGAEAFLKGARALGYRTALGSASKNAPLILDRLQIAELFDAVVDGNSTTRSKPDPEVFLLAASKVGVAPHKCCVFEDAEAGIEAALRAGMKAIGVGESDGLAAADLHIEGFEHRDVHRLMEELYHNSH
jgi:beta-phosphoglucomutase